MLEFEPLSDKNLSLLDRFLTSLGTGADTFRYFSKRPVEVVLGHLYAVILLKDQVPIAYGHLEREGSDLWLGVAVSEAYQGNGFGKKMVNHLLEHAKSANETSVTITVDKVNFKAIQLYEMLGFIRIAEKEHFYKCNYRLK
jgi:ribosomal protein S18 acetylase RimI-like enzyme